MKNELIGINNHLIHGDALNPSGSDIIAQTAHINVGCKLDSGWTVMTGNSQTSLIGRVVMRMQIEDL